MKVTSEITSISGRCYEGDKEVTFEEFILAASSSLNVVLQGGVSLRIKRNGVGAMLFEAICRNIATGVVLTFDCTGLNPSEPTESGMQFLNPEGVKLVDKEGEKTRLLLKFEAAKPVDLDDPFFAVKPSTTQTGVGQFKIKSTESTGFQGRTQPGPAPAPKEGEEGAVAEGGEQQTKPF